MQDVAPERGCGLESESLTRVPSEIGAAGNMAAVRLNRGVSARGSFRSDGAERADSLALRSLRKDGRS